MSDNRKRLVQRLRALGRKCGIELIRDSAARDKVQVFAQAIAGSSGAAQDKEAAAAIYLEYEATWPAEEPEADDDGEGEDQEEQEEPVNRLRGKSFLFTYNWGTFG